MRGGRPLAQSVEDCLRAGPRKVLEKDHHLLRTATDGARFADDQRRGEEILLLQSEMRMHPARAGRRGGKVEITRRPGRDRRPGQVGNPVLAPGLRQSMPVKAGENAEAVLQSDVELVALVQGETESAGSLRSRRSASRPCRRPRSAASACAASLRRSPASFPAPPPQRQRSAVPASKDRRDNRMARSSRSG